MAEFPIVFNIQGDYGFKVTMVDEDETIDQVIRKAADQIVGVLVAPFPAGTTLCARIHGAEAPLPGGITVKQAQLIQMEALDIYPEGAA